MRKVLGEQKIGACQWSQSERVPNGQKWNNLKKKKIVLDDNPKHNIHISGSYVYQ